jgi:predicted hydrolase (HD superfamily)
MNRQEALGSVRANVENENLVKYMLAEEAVMRALFGRLGDIECALTS